MSDDDAAADPRSCSPCVDVCTFDAQTELCDGCRRTLQEIAWWSQYTAAERRRILAELPGR
jgi:predicted Fe-S protein YdhL (DUF1289 family)